MKYRFFLYLIILQFFLISAVYSGYFADIKISVANSGAVSVTGKTDYKPFLNITNSQKYTSKNGVYWILNITTQQKFDDYIFELDLPQYSQVNYIKTTPNFRIAEENNRIKIIGTGQNKPFTLVVQYKIEPKISPIDQDKVIFILAAVVLIIIVLSLFVIIRMMRNHKNELPIIIKNEYDKNNVEVGKDEIDISILPQRQQQIINVLQQRGKITQKQLEDEMNIPKSSVSRNVQSLVIKGILKKESAGQSNYISLKNQ